MDQSILIIKQGLIYCWRKQKILHS